MSSLQPRHRTHCCQRMRLMTAYGTEFFSLNEKTGLGSDTILPFVLQPPSLKTLRDIDAVFLSVPARCIQGVESHIVAKCPVNEIVSIV